MEAFQKILCLHWTVHGKGALRSVAALTRLESPDKNSRTLAVVCSGRIRSDDDDGSSASKFLSWRKVVRIDNQFAL